MMRSVLYDCNIFLLPQRYFPVDNSGIKKIKINTYLYTKPEHLLALTFLRG